MTVTAPLTADLTVDAAHALAAGFLAARRARHGAARMDAGTAAPATGTDTGAATAGTFTQADVDRLVSASLAREKAAADKRIADANRSAEQRLADLERDLAESRTAATRSKIAARHNLGDLEDLLGSGTDDELEARAKRLAERLGTSKDGKDGKDGRQTQTRTRRTVVEPSGNAALDKKAAAAEALRALAGGRGTTD